MKKNCQEINTDISENIWLIVSNLQSHSESNVYINLEIIVCFTFRIFFGVCVQCLSVQFSAFLVEKTFQVFTDVFLGSFFNHSQCTYYQWNCLCFKFPHFCHFPVEVFIFGKLAKFLQWNIFISRYSDIHYGPYLFFKIFDCYVWQICIEQQSSIVTLDFFLLPLVLVCSYNFSVCSILLMLIITITIIILLLLI